MTPSFIQQFRLLTAEEKKLYALVQLKIITVYLFIVDTITYLNKFLVMYKVNVIEIKQKYLKAIK